ncbi:MAG: YeeE/YedE family protein [Bdellovibrionaceae bacterium]|nr:YeeE/YedE family protein [Pseudobdellovibrionaceae bacterium]
MNELLVASIIHAVVGGILIGIASSLMLVFNGRVTGIAGIYNGILSFVKKDTAWRVAFVLGLVTSGIIGFRLFPELFINQSGRSLVAIVVAGLLVGFGTVLGSGCTSGHGVCGIARLSIRSLVATLAFMASGFLAASIFEYYF